ncbi:hypothetical protein GCM10011416_04860 [Polaribacter pacificus]|uniref:LTD domain-containing protein n=1 Tax=Polaribacter pacificus TaxID=1775173 RepID=A0A917HUW8_9FLAO|nr:MBG domain-containing protein [Polaribacter pacificus]GGG91284.1 hypothetical protein GCM10011416_04860 [Polaribacter pacificus]
MPVNLQPTSLTPQVNSQFQVQRNNSVGVTNKTTSIFTAEASAPPVFENSTPATTSITSTSFKLETDIDEAGTIYYVVLADGATAPTAAEVKAGTGNGGASAISSGNTAVTSGDFTNDFNITGLTENTTYNVYVVAEDDETTPLLQASATLVSVKTFKPLAKIVISEIMYNPPESGGDENEYIELYNAGTATVDLTGYSFSKGVTHTFTTGSIAAGAYFVIAVKVASFEAAFGAGTADASLVGSQSLSNGGEEIELVDDVNRIVDYVHYDNSSPWPTGVNGDGPSMELRDITSDNNVGANWSASNDVRDFRTSIPGPAYLNNLPIRGTPGLAANFDIIAPVFETSKPATASITTTGFTLETDIDEAGTIYYVVLADGATAPTAAEVKAGTGNGGASVVASGNTTVTSGGFTHNFSVTGLTEGTAYDVYVVAQDDEGTPNLQTNPTKIEVTTLTLLPTNNILYVKKNISGGNGNGSSWANAIPELADALVWANKNKANFTTTPLQIWVAKGTYKPLYSPENGANFGTDQTRDNAFLMVNNVQLYGGFAGTETLLTDRDLSLSVNKTILSGDIGTVNDTADNTYHVVISTDAVGTARLDGFTITGGGAGGSSNLTVNTQYVLKIRGGGMYNNNSSPTITNSTFSGNTATNYGGGMYNDNNSSPTITNTTFIGNTSAKSGGGMYNKNNSSPTITNSTFSGNTATNDGGGMYNDTFSTKVYNSIITGTVYDASSSPVYKNSIIADKSYDNTGTATTTNLTATDLFKDSANGDYSLNAFSPAINAGDNTLYTGTIATDKDLAGNARLFAGIPDPDVIDLGAYEFQAEPLKITPTNGILYVNKTATGNKTGDSWANAIPELADALLWAHENKADFTTTSLQIWVAKGTYKPMYSPEDGKNFVDSGRKNAFLLINNVALYGGFAGTETAVANRDLSNTANKTILSGDFNGDDTITGSGSTLSIGNNTENAYHVVYSVGNVGTARLDGFTVSGGNATYATYMYVNTVRTNTGYGGGLFNENSSPAIANSTFSRNKSEHSGGGIHNKGGSPSITNVVFSENIAVTGGGLFSDGSTSQKISNSFFTKNSAISSGSTTSYGGGLTFAGSTPTIINNVFIDNFSDLGGALFTTSNITIINSTFNANTTSSNNAIKGGSNDITLVNSIVWNSVLGASGSNITFKNSIYQGTLYNKDNTATSNTTTKEELFKDPANGDFSLNKKGLAVNSGNNDLYTGTLSTDKDIAGNTRLFAGEQNLDNIDIGAYELQSEAYEMLPTNNILYVKKNVSGGNGNGSSWANAVPELAEALAWAHLYKSKFTNSTLQIWVAGGTYQPKHSPEDGKNMLSDGKNNTFLMVKNVQLYGGFAGTETLLSERDLSIATNKTILSGDFNGDDLITGSGSTLSITNNSENAYQVVLSAGDVGAGRLDGFTITGGNASINKLVTVNEKVTWKGYGGGMYNYASSPTIVNCTFSANNARVGGGMDNNNSASPTIINCLFTGNTASDTNGYGGGMSNTKGLPKIINSVFKGNRAQRYGGGLSNSSSSNTTIINSTLTGNAANSSGDELFNGSSTLNIYNTIVWGTIFSYSTLISKNSIIKERTDTTNGNIDVTGLAPEAVFKDAANGDYTLHKYSLAVNAGNNSLYTGTLASDKDFADKTRLYDGDLATDIIDLGAYELQEKSFSLLTDTNNVLYVKKGATGNNKGDSWANAVPELADALVWANAKKANFSTTPLQIWVAKGTYKPKYTPEDGKNFAVGTDAKDNSFLMVKNVQLYGGFAGAETTLAERDLSLTANKTTLSGDFNDDDSVSGSASTLSIGNNTDNAYHIVISADDVGTARLDGFTIIGANASGSGTILVNTKSFLRNYGGGMYLDASSPTIENSTFINNYSSDYGSGIFNNHSSSPKVTASIFKDNKVGSCGAAIYNYNSSKPVITSSFFTGNNAHEYGGAIYDSASSGSKIINSTIVGNSATAAGAGIYIHTSTASIYNSIVWNEITSYGTGSYTLKKTIVQGKLYDQSGTETTTGLTQEKIFKDSSNGDYSLNTSVLNPAINGGDNTFYTGTIASEKDAAGKTRLFDGVATTDVLDLGAYELQAEPIPEAPTGEATQSYAGSATVSSLVATGSTIKWYAAATGGVAIEGTTTLINDTVYYASQTVNGSESTARFAVTAKKVSESSQSFLSSANPTVANLVATPGSGATVKWYTAATGGTALENTVVLTTATYYAELIITGTPNYTTNRVAVTVVVKATPTITFSNLSKTYGDAAFDLTATSTSSAPVTFSVVTGGTGAVTLSGKNVTITKAGTVKFKASVAANANYEAAAKEITLTITKVALTVTADVQSKVYGGTEPILTYTITGFVNGDTEANLDTEVSISRVAGENAGTYTITPSGASGSNYNIAFVSKDFTITKAALTVTADAQSKVYGATEPTLTYTITGFVNEDAESSLDTGVSISRVAGENAGTYTITPSGASGSNYNIAFVSKDFTITKATQTITFGALSHTQDVFDLTATSSSGLAVDYSSSNTAVATISGKTVTVLSGGVTNITATQSGDANYHPATAVVQVLTVIRLGVDEDVLLSKTVQVYPNPATNFIRVDLGNINKAHIKIYSITGKQLLEVQDYTSKEVLNIASLQSGMYLLKIESDTASTMKKFIKK